MAAPPVSLQEQPRASVLTEKGLAAVRLGDIQFLNSWPVTYALRHHRVASEAEITSGTPAEINRRLLSGELDASAISSLLYLKHEEEFVPVPGFCIRADSAVASVLVVSRRPLDQLQWQTIGVTSHGATTPVLLKILLLKRGLRIDLKVTSVRYPQILEEFPAALLIGDEALAAARELKRVWRWDLAAAWTQWTRLPMVFALWAIRRRLLAQDPELPKRIQDALAQSYAWGKNHPTQLIASMQKVFPWPATYFKQYLSRLSYTLDQKAWMGLRRFAKEAQAVGELP